MTPRFLASIQDGKFIYQNPDLLKERIKKLNGKEVWVSLVQKRKGRSNKQNRYYWGALLPILCSEIGELEDEMDLILRKKFLKEYVPKLHEGLKSKFLTDRSKKIPVIGSTASLNTVEFEDYLSKVRMWASSELNIYIPEPNEVPFEY
jgi:hypothetical protein